MFLSGAAVVRKYVVLPNSGAPSLIWPVRRTIICVVFRPDFAVGSAAPRATKPPTYNSKIFSESISGRHGSVNGDDYFRFRPRGRQPPV